MIRVLTSILFLLIHLISFSQDTITLSSEGKIGVKILTISDEYIEYKKSDYIDGPTYKTELKNVESISLKGEESNSSINSVVGARGQIMLERRHYIGAGSSVFFNPRISDPGFALNINGTYFFTPVFGIEVGFRLLQDEVSFNINALDVIDRSAFIIRPTFNNTRFSHYLVAPTFSIPLKHFSLDYKAPFGYTRISTKAKDYTQSASIGGAHTFKIEEMKAGGYSFGGGMAMRFNLTKNNPITFAFGLDMLVSIVSPEYNLVSIHDTTGVEHTSQDRDQNTFVSTNVFVQLVYQINEP